MRANASSFCAGRRLSIPCHTLLPLARRIQKRIDTRSSCCHLIFHPLAAGRSPYLAHPTSPSSHQTALPAAPLLLALRPDRLALFINIQLLARIRPSTSLSCTSPLPDDNNNACHFLLHPRGTRRAHSLPRSHTQPLPPCSSSCLAPIPLSSQNRHRYSLVLGHTSKVPSPPAPLPPPRLSHMAPHRYSSLLPLPHTAHTKPGCFLGFSSRQQPRIW